MSAPPRPEPTAKATPDAASAEEELLRWIAARAAAVAAAAASAQPRASAPAPVVALAGLFGDDDGVDFLADTHGAADDDPFADVVALDARGGDAADAPDAGNADAEAPAPAALSAAAWRRLDADEALARCDRATGELLLACLAASPAAARAEGGAATRLLVAALRSAAPDLVAAALAEVERRGLSTLQVEVAACLRRPEVLGHAGVEAALAVLDVLADGRVVREMEAVLAAHSDGLTQHQAWRARHIVQRIRRGGRR
jgi:hypothetical protein